MEKLAEEIKKNLPPPQPPPYKKLFGGGVVLMIGMVLLMGACMHSILNKSQAAQFEQYSSMTKTVLEAINDKMSTRPEVNMSAQGVSVFKGIQNTLAEMGRKLAAATRRSQDSETQTGTAKSAPAAATPQAKDQSLTVGSVVVAKPGVYVVNQSDKHYKTYYVIPDSGPKERWKKEEIIAGAKPRWATLIPYRGGKIFLQVVGESFVSSIEEFESGTWFWKPTSGDGGGVRSQNIKDLE